MPGTDSPSKVCVVCGESVAGKPRVKDAAGRYTCAGACHDQHVAAVKAAARAKSESRAAPAPSPGTIPVGDERSVLSDLISQSPMLKAGKCEQCGGVIPQGGVICTRCGFNSQTGKNLRTAVYAEKVKKESKIGAMAGDAGSTTMAVLRSPIIFGSIIALGLGAIGLVGVLVPEFTLASVVIVGVVYLIAIIWGLIDAIQEQEYTWAGFMIYHVIGGFIPISILRFGSIIGFFAAVGYIVFVCDRPVLKSLFIGSLLAFVGQLVGIYMSRGSFEFQ